MTGRRRARLPGTRLRGGWHGVIGLAVVALLLAACGAPAGLDGSLVDDWKALPDATVPVPTPGACYDVATDDPATVTRWPAPVECTAKHTVETVHVGAFTGPDAERESSPSAGSPGRRTAYETCTAAAKTYLGDDWRTGRLDLSVVLPIASHWQGGARWFRCDLIEYQDLEDYAVVSRTASLRAALSGPRPVGLSCVAVTLTADGTRLERMVPADCAGAHNGEFAGVLDLPDGPYPQDAAAAKARLDGCGKVVAGYTALPEDASLQARIGWIASPFGEVAWALGNRGVRCYAHSDQPLTGSIKGAGPTRLPAD